MNSVGTNARDLNARDLLVTDPNNISWLNTNRGNTTSRERPPQLDRKRLQNRAQFTDADHIFHSKYQATYLTSLSVLVGKQVWGLRATVRPRFEEIVLGDRLVLMRELCADSGENRQG